MHCIHACVGEQHKNYLATSLKSLIIKKSHQQQENQTNGGNKDGTVIT